MKLLSSSSSTSNSTISTYSFDGSFYISKNTTAGCIAGVFRRLLCRNTLPTHPAKNEPIDPPEKVKYYDEIEALGTTNIVARLMGLESMPQKLDTTTTLNVISRSQSMNSLQSRKEIESKQGRHQRVRSFREIPNYRELEDDNFFILSFENVSKNEKISSKERKSNKGCKQPEQRSQEKVIIREELKQHNVNRRGSVYEKNKENFCNIKNNERENPMDTTYILGSIDILKETSNVLHTMKINSEETRIKKKKKIEQEIDAQSSSPNSVLDLVELPVDREASNSATVDSKSKRTLWEELENYRKFNPCSDKKLNSNDHDPKARGGNCVGLLQKKDYEGHEHVENWTDLCKFADRETLQSYWISKEIRKMEDYENIIRDLESYILDDLVDQLIGNFSCKI